MPEEIYDLAVIGSGPAGYVAALRASELGLKTVCIEKDATFGGTCLNVGCIPSKALLQSTEYFSLIKEDGKQLGIIAEGLQFDFNQMQKRKEEIVKGLISGISGLFKQGKIAAKQGIAKFLTPTRVSISGKEKTEELEARNFIIATGSEPTALPFLPFDEKQILSSTGALSLPNPPKTMVVIGAGVIGVELASVYQRLGSEITIIEMLDRVCPTMDAAVSKTLLQLLKKQGLKFHLSAKLLKATPSDAHVDLEVEIEGNIQKLTADVVLVAVGRRPYTKGLGLESVGIVMDKRGFIPVDGNFRTSQNNIYAIGDVVEGPMLAHRASTEAYAAVEIIAGLFPRINYMAIPNIVYTHPEAAGVGLTEKEALEKGLKIKIGTASFRANARARCLGYAEGIVKVIGEAEYGHLIGMHIVGPQASELIAEGAVAINSKATLQDLAALCHAHPTLTETMHEAILNAQ